MISYSYFRVRQNFFLKIWKMVLPFTCKLNCLLTFVLHIASAVHDFLVWGKTTWRYNMQCVTLDSFFVNLSCVNSVCIWINQIKSNQINQINQLITYFLRLFFAIIAYLNRKTFNLFLKCFEYIRIVASWGLIFSNPKTRLKLPVKQFPPNTRPICVVRACSMDN